MSAEETRPSYRHIGGGRGEIEVPERVDLEYRGWEIRCFLWTGSEYWYAARTHPVPAEAAARGVVEFWRGWSSAESMRIWLTGQQQAWDAWAASSTET